MYKDYFNVSKIIDSICYVRNVPNQHHQFFLDFDVMKKKTEIIMSLKIRSILANMGNKKLSLYGRI